MPTKHLTFTVARTLRPAPRPAQAHPHVLSQHTPDALAVACQTEQAPACSAPEPRVPRLLAKASKLQPDRRGDNRHHCRRPTPTPPHHRRRPTPTPTPPSPQGHPTTAIAPSPTPAPQSHDPTPPAQGPPRSRGPTGAAQWPSRSSRRHLGEAKGGEGQGQRGGLVCTAWMCFAVSTVQPHAGSAVCGARRWGWTHDPRCLPATMCTHCQIGLHGCRVDVA